MEASSCAGSSVSRDHGSSIESNANRAGPLEDPTASPILRKSLLLATFFSFEQLVFQEKGPQNLRQIRVTLG